jgi:methyl-accepting chemotaxis protein
VLLGIQTKLGTVTGVTENDEETNSGKRMPRLLRLGNVTIRARIAALGIVGVASILTLGLGGFYSAERIDHALSSQKDTDRIIAIVTKIALERDELRGNVYKTVWATRSSLEFQSIRDKMRDDVEALAEAVAEAELSADVLNTLESIAKNVETYLTAAEGAYMRDVNETDLRNVLAKFESSYGTLRGGMASSTTLLRYQQQESNDKILGAVRAAATFAALAGVLCFLLISVVGESTRRRLSRGVGDMRRVVSKVRQGDLTLSVESGRQDELGDIATDINSVIRSYQDSMRRVRDRGAELAEAAGHMNKSANELGQVADTAATSARDLAESITTISAMGQQISGAAQELAESVSEIKHSTVDASRVAVEAVRAAKEGNQRMEQLGAAERDIKKVVDLITSIASQTHMLALNAAIEAARAGVAGQGFGVVAGEVKNLAAQTAAAAEDIRERIAAVSHGSEAAIESFTEIIDVVERIAESHTAIAGAIAQQTGVAKEISQGITEVATATSLVAGGAENASKSAETVRKQQETLAAGAKTIANIAQTAAEMSSRYTI